MAEVHVQRFALAIPEGRVTTPGVVDQLVRAGQHARPVGLGDAADGVERQHPARAGLVQGMQVGPVVDPVRRQRMTLAMAGEEGHRGLAQAADAHRPGGRAPGRVEVPRLHVFQRGQPVHAGAADHRQRERHGQSLSA